MGIVYKAFDERLEREVAIKLLAFAPTDEGHDVLRARFHREARLAARLRSRHVVAIYDFGTDRALDVDFLVMELLCGIDLARLIRGVDRVELGEAYAILLQVAHGLEVGHSQGLVHRDVKPSNIFVTRLQSGGAPHVHILDFGIAQPPVEHGTLTHLTAPGSIPMTPAYASPEQIVGWGELTPASDVFSLGVTAFELLTGTLPYGDVAALIRSGASRAGAPSMQGLRPEIPTAIEEVIRCSLLLPPERRFSSAGEFARALEEAIRGATRRRFSPRASKLRIGEWDSPAGDSDLDELKSLFGTRELVIQGDAVTDSGLEKLAHLEVLERLRIWSESITDEGLLRLQHMMRLELLDLTGARITSSGLGLIGRFIRLRELWLPRTDVADEGLPALRNLARLESLSLGETLVTDAGMPDLGALRTLRLLRVDGTRITDAGVKALSALVDLRELWLEHTSVTDEGMLWVSRLPALEKLFLRGTRVSRVGLEHLQRCGSLRFINVEGTRVSYSDAEDFRRVHPDLQVRT